MAQSSNAGAFRRQVQAAQREYERKSKKAVADANRQLQADVAKCNRAAEAQNRRAVSAYNKEVDKHNQKVVADFTGACVRRDQHHQFGTRSKSSSSRIACTMLRPIRFPRI